MAVRDRVDGDLGALPLAEVIDRLTREVEARTIRQISTGTAASVEGGEKFAD